MNYTLLITGWCGFKTRQNIHVCTCGFHCDI